MAFAPLILMAASAAVSAVGAISSARAQAAGYDAQKKAAIYNANQERINANAAIGAADANELVQRRENDQKMAALRARVAESGGGFVGTNVGVLNQAADNLELSALATRYQGTARASGLLAQANLDEYQSNVAGMNSRASITAGNFGAIGAALGATSSYANTRSLVAANNGGNFTWW